MPENLRMPIVVVAIVLAVLVGGSLFIVSETEQVVITQWGRPVGRPITEAGLHFKLPIIQKANFFEKRVLKWDGSPNQIPTRDKKYIWVDTTARWRIKDPLLFLQRVGTVTTAMSRLDGIIDSVVRDHVSNNQLVELVRSEGWERARESLLEAGLGDYQIMMGDDAETDPEASTVLAKGREKITREMVADASRLLPEFGIELLDIRIKRINYVQTVQQRVFERMISERKRIAAQYRSEGEGERAAILGQMERDLARIQSEAYRAAEEIRGKADAQATRIYAETYGRNPKFYQFYQTLDFYKRYENPRGLFVMGTDAELFRYLRDREPDGDNP